MVTRWKRAPRDLLVLRRRERDLVGAPDPAHHEVFERGSPAAPDVERETVGANLGIFREDLRFVLLRLFQRLPAGQVARGCVMHPLVEPEPEEVVGQASILKPSIDDLNVVQVG